MRIPMPIRKEKERILDFKEVNIGYSLNEAVAEASRCLQCKNPECIEGCPIGVDIQGFIKCIKNKNIKGAAQIIKRMNNLLGVCGRVCPQERLCEEKCILAKKGEAVAIGHLARFTSDNEDNIFILPNKIPKNQKQKKVKRLHKNAAIVGSGPSGLACAADLAGMGYDVTVYEALHEPGGVLRYGIPEFRLPKKIVNDEIEKIRKMGVKFLVNHVIGKTFTIDDLQKEYDAVFIGTGAGLPNLPSIHGEHLNGVITANEFLTRINLMKAYSPDYDTPVKKAKQVIVVGGGNTAVDSARAAKRLGSDVTIVYRRSFAEMPARMEEIKHAKEEGINFIFLTQPTRIIGRKKVKGIELIQMMLEGQDSSGRMKPVPIENTEFEMGCNQVIFAIGQGPNPMMAKTTKISHRMDKSIVVDSKLRTSKTRVFAGGDIIGGDATVIRAIRDGKIAAMHIDEMLREK